MGQYANTKHWREIVWEKIVWPLALEKGRPSFSEKEYHDARARFVEREGANEHYVAGGLKSLLTRGYLRKEGDVYQLIDEVGRALNGGKSFTYADASNVLKNKRMGS